MSGSTIKLDNGEYAMRVAVLQSPSADGNDGGQATGAGAVSAGVQRVTLASDDPAVAALAPLTPNTTAASGIAPVVTSSLATSKVIKASAGNLYSLNCCATTVAGIFLLHNTTSAPAAGAVTPVRAWPVGIGQGLELQFDPPLRLGTGVSVTFTTAATPFTQTDSATAFIAGEAV